MLRRVIRGVACMLVLAAPRAAFADWVYLLSEKNVLGVVEIGAPGQLVTTISVTGLEPADRLVAIDFRPKNSQLYALAFKAQGPGNVAAHLYRVHMLTGAATRIGTVDLPLANAEEVGFDFNPVTDEIRVVTSNLLNFRVNPDTGAMVGGQRDTDIQTLGRIHAIGHSYSTSSSPGTTLYAIDVLAGLVRIGGPGGTPSPNGGTVTFVGGSSPLLMRSAGLDVAAPNNRAYAVLPLATDANTLATISLPTGAWTPLGQLPRIAGELAVDIAVLSRAPMLYGFTADHRLVRFRADDPENLLSDVPIVAPLVNNEVLRGLDVRPSNRQIFALSSAGRVFSIAPDGIATLVGTTSGNRPSTIGLSFNPFTDDLRVTDGTGINHRLDVTNQVFATSVDSTLTTANVTATGIVGIAYNLNPFANTTTLYGVHATNHALVRIGGPGGVPSPNGGQVTPLVNFTGITPETTAFAIDPATNTGFLAQQGTHLCPPPDPFAALIDDDPNEPPDDEPDDPGDDPPPGQTLCHPASFAAIDLSSGTRLWSGFIGEFIDQVQGLAVVPAGTVRLELSQVDVSEAAGTVAIKVRRGAGDAGPISVDYKTANGTAQAGADYVAGSGMLVFLDGETEKTIIIPILNDTAAELPLETFTLTIAAPTLGARLGALTTITVRIADDESPANQKPTIQITSPTTNPTYELSTVLLDLSGTASDDRSVTSVTWFSSNGDAGTAQGTTNWLIGGVEIDSDTPTAITVTAHDEFGDTATDTITVTRANNGVLTYVLAEGATGAFFDTDILLANADGNSAAVTLTFLKEDGGTIVETRTLPATSRMTVRVDEIPGMEATSASTIITSSRQIIVERTMRWATGAGYGAHTEKAVDGAATTWYFAEGSQGFFSTYLLLANPQTSENTATVEFLREGESPLTRTYTIAANARRTIDASADSELVNRSFGMTVTFAKPGVAERAMYFGTDPFWKAGHESAGVTLPSTTWFLAEGATGPFFDTFVLLSNPQASAANVTLTYLVAGGAPITKTASVPAHGRLTVNIEQEDPALANVAVATQVEASVPIVVERAQYWPYTFDQWYEAHNSFGVVALNRFWGLAEGRVGGADGYETYILLANPGTDAAAVKITFLRTNGTTIEKTFTVPAQSRFNVATGATGPVPELANEEFGAKIESSRPIAVERAMYSSPGGLTWSAGTNATATRLVVP